MSYESFSFLERPTQEYIGAIEDNPIVVKIRNYSHTMASGYQVLVEYELTWYLFELRADATCEGNIPDGVAEFIEKETGYYCKSPKENQ